MMVSIRVGEIMVFPAYMKNNRSRDFRIVRDDRGVIERFPTMRFLIPVDVIPRGSSRKEVSRKRRKKRQVGSMVSYGSI